MWIQPTPSALKEMGTKGRPGGGKVSLTPNRKAVLEGPLVGVSILMELSCAKLDSNHDRLIEVDVALESTMSMDSN